MTISVQDNIANAVYKNKLPWPEMPRNLNDLALAEIDTIKASVRSGRDAYHEEDRRVYVTFEQDLALEFGTFDNPKRQKLFEMSWNRAHSSGLQAVYEEYQELSELIL